MSQPTSETLFTKILDQPILTGLNRLLQAAAIVLVLGIVIITLSNYQDTLGSFASLIPAEVTPEAVAGGATVLVALSFIGIPTGVAAVAATSVWLLLQNFLA